MLRAEGIAKFYGATRALDGVHFEARRGEVHAIVGQNGAGKSTLMGLLAGRMEPDQGQLYLDGVAIRMDSPLRAIESGVAMVYQTREVVPELSVAENIFLGRLPLTRFGLIDWPNLFRDAQELVTRLGFEVDVRRPVGLLHPAGRQLTEIARALSMSAKVLILDEPSAALCRSELESLFRILRRLRDKGKTILYVTHHLGEVFEVADRVTVLRDGKMAGTYSLHAGIDARFLIDKMVGEEWNEKPQARIDSAGAELLRVERLSRSGVFKDVSFTLRAGETVGLAGLVGSGAGELCGAVFGAVPYHQGLIYVDGKPARVRSPRQARDRGLAYLPEDRGAEGIVADLPVSANLTLSTLRRFASGGILHPRAEANWSEQLVRRLGVRCARVSQRASQLSGGNQQKVLLGRWLGTGARIFLLVNPTAGVDIAAKSQIHRLMRELAAEGRAILLLSSDIRELLDLCGRILVMSRGRITHEVNARAASEEDILYSLNEVSNR
jgi:ABC-type sugar transport system ATPase subunit